MGSSPGNTIIKFIKLNLIFLILKIRVSKAFDTHYKMWILYEES
jgi:hypothetical protein